jgi:hypothetical protein
MSYSADCVMTVEIRLPEGGLEFKTAGDEKHIRHKTACGTVR